MDERKNVDGRKMWDESTRVLSFVSFRSSQHPDQKNIYTRVEHVEFQNVLQIGITLFPFYRGGESGFASWILIDLTTFVSISCHHE